MMASLLTRLRHAFAIDLEMLAVFRFLLAVLVIWGLLGRVQIRDHLFPLDVDRNLSIVNSNSAEEFRLPDDRIERATPENVWFIPSESLETPTPDNILYSSRDSRSVWTSWHWSLLWLDQVVENAHTTLLSVQKVAPVADMNRDNGRSFQEPLFSACHEPMQRLTSFFSGRSWFDGVIGIGVATAILFGLGLFTKSSNLLLWIVVVSVQHRMPLFNSGADSLERLFLFWMLFLPSGAVLSLDAWWFSRQGFWRKRINQIRSMRYEAHMTSGQPMMRSHSICNLATAAILVQLVAIYWYSALAKLNADWWTGSAVEQALQWGFITKPLATQWLEQPVLLRFVTWSVLIVELFCPFLVFCPGIFGWTRRATTYFFVSMHLAIAATLSIGTFSAICAAGWLLFFAWPTGPSGGWSSLLWERRDCPKALPQRLASSGRPQATAAEWSVVVLMILTAWWNVSQASIFQSWLKFPRALEPLVCQLGLDPSFPMFGQVPQHDYGWVHRVELETGVAFDLRPELPSPLNVPNRGSSWYEPHSVYLWRQLHVNLVYLEAQQLEFVSLVRERLHRLEFQAWQEKARRAGSLSAREIDSAYSLLLLVDQKSGEEEVWGSTEL